MGKCCICSKQIVQEEPAVLFIDNNDKEQELCPECEELIDTLIEREDADKIKDTVNKIYFYTKKINNAEVASCLDDMVKSNASRVFDLEQKARVADYFEDMQEKESSNGWKSCLNFLAWAFFILTIIGGFIIAVPYFEYQFFVGVIILLATLVVALLGLSLVKVILQIADDVSEIKDKKQ